MTERREAIETPPLSSENQPPLNESTTPWGFVGWLVLEISRLLPSTFLLYYHNSESRAKDKLAHAAVTRAREYEYGRLAE
jgi:hypothetical protein